MALQDFTVYDIICRNAHNFADRESIVFTYIEAQKKYGVSIPRLKRAIDDLLAKGFITIIHQGGAYKRDKTIYGLSDKWRLWTPGIKLETRSGDVHRGWQN